MLSGYMVQLGNIIKQFGDLTTWPQKYINDLFLEVFFWEKT